MRAYFFVNMYMQGIHAGIQAGHCLGRMVKKYGMNDDNYANAYQFGMGPATPEGIQLQQFLDKHETFILLNGGDQASLLTLVGYLDQASKSKFNEFPWATFNESQEALNGALTCVGVVLPERIYKFAELLRTDKELLPYRMEDQFSRYGFAYFDHTHGDDPNYRINNRWELDFAKNLNTYSLAR